MRRALAHSALVAVPALALGAGCFKTFDDDTPPAQAPIGLTAMVRVSDVPPGDECPAGGVLVETGVDRDRDGALDDEELDGGKSLVCAPGDGAAAAVHLARVVEEPAGETCAAGGVRVESGLDLDADGALGDGEVERVEVLCSGSPGATGGEGLVSMREEPAGATCPSGGVRVDLGLDLDGDGVLDDAEVATTEYACHGEAGADGAPGPAGLEALVAVVDVAAGPACVSGGKRVDAGLDADRDGALDLEEVERSAIVCHGADGGAGPGGAPPVGVSEGSVAAPVALDVGARDGPPLHDGTVAALGTSYYTFTTLADPSAPGAGDAPYTVALFDFRSDVDVQVFSGADFASGPVPVSCRFLDVRTKVCATSTLQEGATYHLALTERDNLPGAYQLTVSFSADVGSPLTPISIAEQGTPIGGGFTLDGAVSGGGASEYSFTPVADGLFTVFVDDIAGPPGGAAPALTWEIYEGSSLSDEQRLFTCGALQGGAVACPTPWLRAGTEYRIRVVETAGAGASYRLDLVEDDVLTPRIALAEVTDLTGLGALALLVPATSGPHTLTVAASPQGWTLYADVGAAQRGSASATCTYPGCAVDLDSARPAYVALPASAASVLAYVDEGGGTEGAPDAPLAVSLDALHEGSVAEGEGSSYYAFTTRGQTSRYSVDIAPPPIGVTTVTCEVAADLERTTLVTAVLNVSASGLVRCVTERLQPDSTYYVRLDTASSASRFDFTVREGDTLTPTLAPGAAVVQDVTNDFLFRVDAAPGLYEFRMTGAVDRMQRRLYAAYPFNGSLGNDYVFRCETNNFLSGHNSSDCVRTVPLQPEVDYYLHVNNRTGANSLTVEVVPVPVEDVTFGAPLTGQALPPLGELWYRIALASDAVVTARLDFTSSGDYRIQLYDEGFNLFSGTTLSWDATAGGSRSHSFQSASTPVPAGTWYLKIREGVYASETLTFDLTVTTP